MTKLRFNQPLSMEGSTTFNFVTDGVESALEQAKEAAGDKVVMLSGGPFDVDYLRLAGIAASSKATTAVCTAFAAPARS